MRFVILQLLAAALALAGLYVLAGPGWTALVAGVLLLGVFTRAEQAADARPPGKAVG